MNLGVLSPRLPLSFGGRQPTCPNPLHTIPLSPPVRDDIFREKKSCVSLAQRVGAGGRGGHHALMGTLSHAILVQMPGLQLLVL